MKRSPGKKPIERRKRSRGTESKRKASTATSATSTPSTTTSSRDKASTIAVSKDGCKGCGKHLGADDRALFVEEEIGRVFCSEECISSFFSPDIERLEKEFFRRLSSSDLTGEEREKFAHLRWITLQEPDEVWREKTLAGDYRYTLISEFQPATKKIWSICICLFLRGEPSFLYLAFTTKNAAMVATYRRGEQVEWVRPEVSGSAQQAARRSAETEGETGSDRLADPWTEDETFMAQANSERREDDIPATEFSLYQSCVEEALETPDEVWTSTMTAPVGGVAPKMYHFIRYYPDEKPAYWYIVVARETDPAPAEEASASGESEEQAEEKTDDTGGEQKAGSATIEVVQEAHEVQGAGVDVEEQIEILDAFPTRDESLVDRYRRGEQEIGQFETRTNARVVH